MLRVDQGDSLLVRNPLSGGRGDAGWEESDSGGGGGRREPGPPVVRYERERPIDLLHLDTK